MEKLEEIMEYISKIENLELYLFLILLLFTLWFIRNTIKYYKGEKKKVKTLHRFAKAGEVAAQFQLAKRYQKGKAVKKSCNKAAFWYRQAAYSGDKAAKEQWTLFSKKRNSARNHKKC